jgi:hypothetical protein
MIIAVVFFMLLTSIFSSKVTSSATQPFGLFNILPGDVIRYISEFTDHPFIMRSINKASYNSIPSAQSMIANNFDSNLLNFLSSTPELWHLLKFEGKLHDLLKDSARFLPQSFPLIAEAVTLKLLDGSLILPPEIVKHFYKIFKENNLTHLIPKNCQPLGENLHFLILQTLYMPIDEQLSEIERIIAEETTAEDLFVALLETIKTVSYQDGGLFDRITELVCNLSGKLNNSDYIEILGALLKLKFKSYATDSFYFSSLFADVEEVKLWSHYFALVAIEAFRIDVLRLSLSVLKGSIPQEVQDALLNSPELLIKFSEKAAKSIFNSNKFLKYRIMFDGNNFDTKKQIITKDDVIVSGYKHEPRRFKQVLSRFSWIDFRYVSELLSHFLQDFNLIQNLIVISEILENLEDFPDLILPEISLQVLEFIINNHQSFSGLLGNSFEYFRIVVNPNIMATVLRDNQLYRIIKQNPQIFFDRFYFSFIDSIPIFTEYDWNRLFALSPVPLNFKFRNSFESLRIAHNLLSCACLSHTLDLIKRNMADFIMLEASIELLRSSDEAYLLFSPLLSIWAQNDIISYLDYFHSTQNNLIEN